jgi:O-antigen/teichoic acid export membrane protein
VPDAIQHSAPRHSGGDCVTVGPVPVPEPGAASKPRPPAPRPLASGAFASLTAQVLILAATGVTSVAVARLLGPDGTGAVALLINLVGIGTLVFGLGLRSGIVYELSSGDWGLRQAAWQTALTAIGLGTLGALAVLLLHALTQDSVLAGLDATTAAAAAAALPFAIAVAYTGAIALARERYEAYAAVQILPPVATLLFAVGLAIPFAVTGAAVGIAAATTVTAIAGWAWLYRYLAVAAVAAKRPVRGHLGRAMRFGAQAWGGEVLQFLNYRIDLFILNSFAAIADVGVYSVAVTLTSIAWILPNALTTVLFPREARLAAARRAGTLPQSETDAVAVKGARQAIIMLVPSAAVALALLFVAVPLLYGPRFADTTTLGLLLLPGVLAIGFGKALTAVTTGRGYPRYALYLSLISFPFTIAMYLVLIPPLDAEGAAIATTLSYILTSAVAWLFYRRATGLRFRALIPGRADIREARAALGLVSRTARTVMRRR